MSFRTHLRSSKLQVSTIIRQIGQIWISEAFLGSDIFVSSIFARMKQARFGISHPAITNRRPEINFCHSLHQRTIAHHWEVEVTRAYSAWTKTSSLVELHFSTYRGRAGIFLAASFLGALLVVALDGISWAFVQESIWRYSSTLLFKFGSFTIPYGISIWRRHERRFVHVIL